MAGEVNRRLAAIIAADIVGYSAMIGAEEATTLARVRALRTDLVEPEVTRHAGRLFKSTGDGFLIEFASAVQALRCAIAIQEALGAQNDPLRLRIGVHQGEVVAGPIRPRAQLAGRAWQDRRCCHPPQRLSVDYWL